MIPSMTTLAITNSEEVLGYLVIAVMLLAVVIILSAPYISWFRQELKYINTEISRTEGREKERWMRRKRRLLMSLLPFHRYE